MTVKSLSFTELAAVKSRRYNSQRKGVSAVKTAGTPRFGELPEWSNGPVSKTGHGNLLHPECLFSLGNCRSKQDRSRQDTTDRRCQNCCHFIDAAVCETVLRTPFDTRDIWATTELTFRGQDVSVVGCILVLRGGSPPRACAHVLLPHSRGPPLRRLGPRIKKPALQGG